MPDKEKLQQIVNDLKSSDIERAEAWQELRALDSGNQPTSPAVDRLVEQLLRDALVSSLGEVPNHTVHQFLSELGITKPDANSLYQRWLHESPVARQKMKQMAVLLATCFFDQQEALAARLQDATAKGLDTTAIRREMKKLYEQWVDSTIFNDEPGIRQMMRRVIANTL